MLIIFADDFSYSTDICMMYYLRLLVWFLSTGAESMIICKLIIQECILYVFVFVSYPPPKKKPQQP